MNTRERILEHALERFNADGLTSVGMRDLAQELELSPGNVTYYFPKKEDLIRELAAQLSRQNDETLGSSAPPGDFHQLLDRLRQGMSNLWDYRFLSATFAQVMKEYPTIAEGYGEVESQRRAGFYAHLLALKERGFVRPGASTLELEQLAHSIALIARFGVPDYEVRTAVWHQDMSLDHYIALIARVLLTIASASGRVQLQARASGC